MSTFQCFLIVGGEASQQAETQRIAGGLAVNIKKPSVDLLEIEPQKSLAFGKEGHITIDQIRQLKRSLYQKPIHLPLKIIIIRRAQRLTIEAQNALLKILEEPPQHAIIILLSDDKKSLLPTIISRVISVKTKGPTIAKINKECDLLKKDTFSLLEEVSQVAKPKEWLDNQLLNLYETLVARVKDTELDKLEEVTSIMEKCAYTKMLIEANVNWKLAFYDLIFSINELPLRTQEES